MIHDVVSAKHRGGYKIEVTFDDGRSGAIDFSDYPAKGGVFRKSRDMEFFLTFKVNCELGVIEWGGEIDVAPETLYSQATGAPLPDWMGESEELTNK